MNNILDPSASIQDFNISYNGPITTENCSCTISCGDCNGQNEIFVCVNVNAGIIDGEATGSCSKDTGKDTS